jgi:hypothetical protein
MRDQFIISLRLRGDYIRGSTHLLDSRTSAQDQEGSDLINAPERLQKHVEEGARARNENMTEQRVCSL